MGIVAFRDGEETGRAGANEPTARRRDDLDRPGRGIGTRCDEDKHAASRRDGGDEQQNDEGGGDRQKRDPLPPTAPPFTRRLFRP